MSGIKYFILGFCLSVSSVALYTHLQAPSVSDKNSFSYPHHVSIDLFKNSNVYTKPIPLETLFTPIQKQSIDIPEIEPSQKVADISSEKVFPAEGIEDDEILSINMDADIPIEFSDTLIDEQQAEILLTDNENKSALLPEDAITPTSDTQDESPWVVAKTRSNVKNKKLLEKFNETPTDNLFTEDITQTAQNGENISYKVAEKIKQSIIFPIPDEILNDENLTPTFINKSTSNSSTNTVSTQKNPTSPVQVVEPKAPSINSTSKGGDKSILTSISTWFTEPPTPQKSTAAHQKMTPPTYTSEPTVSNIAQNRDTNQIQSDNLASLYESLQQTKKEHNQRKILPTELKLSFQPGRAEISGSTLQWLKIFSETTFNNDTYLQVRLDASASNELQKRRLNLLYTIFMNNGVDFNKIDTVFSHGEPDAFIIRTIRQK